MRRRQDLTPLTAIPALDGCARQDLAELDARGAQLSMRSGRALCHQGRRATQLVVILEGTAEVTRGGEPVRQLGAGDVVGGTELRIRGRHDVTVVAGSGVRVLVLSAQELAELDEVAPEAFARLTGAWRPAAVAAAVQVGLPAPVRRPALGLLPT